MLVREDGAGWGFGELSREEAGECQDPGRGSCEPWVLKGPTKGREGSARDKDDKCDCNLLLGPSSPPHVYLACLVC